MYFKTPVSERHCIFVAFHIWELSWEVNKWILFLYVWTGGCIAKLNFMDFISDLIFGIVDTVMSVGGIIVKAVPTHRQCNIEIENGSLQYTLCNPR